MSIIRADAAGCISLALALLTLALPQPAAAERIVPSANVHRLGASQAGSQSAPQVAPFGGNGSIITWLSPGGASQHAYVGYFSLFGDPRGLPLKLDFADGPTSGANALSAAPVSFADGSASIFFAAPPRDGAGSAKQDIFLQRMSAFRDKVGSPIRINQTVPNIQRQILATRLSSGNVLVSWATTASGASAFNLRGRVLRPTGIGVANEQAITRTSGLPQTATGLAALTNGNSVIAYFIRSGSGASAKQSAYIQRLSPTGTRLGDPVLIKQTTGPNTYGGVGVAALPGGRYMALWLAPATAGNAALKRQIFQANGTKGPVANVATGKVKATSQNAPKAIASEDGVMVALDSFAGGTYSVTALLLGNGGALLAAPYDLGVGTNALVTTALSFSPASDGYVATWTQTLAGSQSVRSFAREFYVSAGCTVKC